MAAMWAVPFEKHVRSRVAHATRSYAQAARRDLGREAGPEELDDFAAAHEPWYRNTLREATVVVGGEKFVVERLC